jgi:hypothetical protein
MKRSFLPLATMAAGLIAVALIVLGLPVAALVFAVLTVGAGARMPLPRPER